MLCSKCGKEISENARFCTGCGQMLSDSPQIPQNTNSQVSQPYQPPASPYTYNNVKAKYKRQNTPGSSTPASGNTGDNKPRKKKHGFVIFLACLLIVAVLVQLFAYPFMIQRITMGKVSTLAIGKVNPNKSYDGVKDSETKAVISYVKSISRSLSWQLTGHEKNLFNLAARYLDKAPIVVGSISKNLQASNSPELLLADASTGRRSFTEEEIASDLSGIAALLLQRGYTKLAISINALAAEHSPIDPLIINNLACALRQDGLYDDAYKLLGYAYKLSPHSPEILTNMGNICFDQGDTELAATWYDMALASDDDFGLAHEGLMLYYMNQKRYETAMRHMIKASETTFTPAVYKTYERIRYLDNYEDIRDNVLKDFDFSDIARTYQRTRNEIREGVDTPAGQIRIPKFPTYSGVDSFLNGVMGMHDYAMSIINPAIGELEKLGEKVIEYAQMIESFQNNGISGVLDAANKMGLLDKAEQDSGKVEDGKLQLPMDYNREQYTISLLGDYLDMKIKEPMDEMQKKFSSSIDPLLQIGERSIREFEQRGESQQAWLTAMVNNFGNSMSLSDSTVNSNKVSINQHINEFYQAILPAYNEIKPLLEEYWLYCGGVIKYVGDDEIFQLLDSQRKISLYGTLGIFAFYAEFEAINVPLVYATYAINGEPPEAKPAEIPQKFEKPEEEVPYPDETFSLDLGIFEVEWSNGEIEVEVTALIAAGVKYNRNDGTVTLAGGVGLSSGDLVPMLGGKITGTYYVVLSKQGVHDHGVATKTEYSVGEGVKYKVKEVTKVSTVYSTTDVTVEKAIVGGKIFTAGFKRTQEE